MVIAAAGSTYLTMSFTEFKTAYRSQDLLAALNLAEADLEDVILAMKHDTLSSSTPVATGHYYRKEDNVYLGNGRVGTIKTYASILDTTAPILFAEGEITSKYGTVKKQLRVDLSSSGPFANGLTAKDFITWNGNNVYVDSYNSDDGDYVFSIRRDNGTVASMSIVAGAVSPGNGDIYGYVATRAGEPNFGPNGSLTGADTPNGMKIDRSRIAKDFWAELPDASAPSTIGALTLIPASGTIGTPTALSPTYYSVSSFSNNNNDTLVIDGPVVFVVEGDWTSKGEIQITTRGSLELYISGDLDIGGNGTVNMTNIPEKLLVFGTNTVINGQTIKISGNGAIKAAVYAPNANLEMKGGGNQGTFMGAAVANQITMTGNSNFHYDEALKEYSFDTKYRINRWRELIESDERVPLDEPTQMIAHAVSYEESDNYYTTN